MTFDPPAGQTHTYTLELDLASEPMTGVLKGAGGQHPFIGWIGLAQALEAAAADDDGGGSLVER